MGHDPFELDWQNAADPDCDEWKDEEDESETVIDFDD